jgi:hypothetical protein
MPTTTPKQTIRYVRLSVWAERRKPTVRRMQPVIETLKGPSLSWRRPAMMKERAKTTTAQVNTWDVSARFQPNSFSRGATKTLQAYSEPRARFIKTPPTTRHHRLM